MIDPLAFFTEEEKARLRAIPDELAEDLYGVREGQYETRRKLFPTGKKIEGTMLTVIGHRRGSRGPEVICQCDCTKVVAIRYRTLYGGSPYSCGCTPRPKNSAVQADGIVQYGGTSVGRPKTDYAGYTFGRLTVLEYKGPAFGWSCLCADCQELEMVPPMPGQAYGALLNRTGRKPCATKARLDARKPLWTFTLRWVNPKAKNLSSEQAGDPVRANTREEAMAEARKQCGEFDTVVNLREA